MDEKLLRVGLKYVECSYTASWSIILTCLCIIYRTASNIIVLLSPSYTCTRPSSLAAKRLKDCLPTSAWKTTRRITTWVSVCLLANSSEIKFPFPYLPAQKDAVNAVFRNCTTEHLIWVKIFTLSSKTTHIEPILLLLVDAVQYCYRGLSYVLCSAIFVS